MNAHRLHRQNHAGFTMIEVLVTLIVFSVGLLGLAALQITGIRSTTGAISRTQASLGINDLTERMRANITAVDANTFSAINSTAFDCTAAPNPICSEYYNGTANTAAQDCTTAQMAAYDLNIWFCGTYASGNRYGGVKNILPSATASIACSDSDTSDTDACTDRSPHIVTIGWTENNPQNDVTGSTSTRSISFTVNL